MDELAAARPAPAALEEDPPAARPRHGGDSPTLRARDVREQVVRVLAELVGQEPLHLVEEARLVTGADHRVRPDALDREVLHPGSLREPPQPAVPDDRPDPRGRAVVRDVDHGMERRPTGGVEASVLVMQLVEIGDQQHRLDDAGAHEGSMQMGPVDPTLAGHHRERLHPGPSGEIPAGPIDAVAARIAERGLAGALVQGMAAAVESVLTAMRACTRGTHRRERKGTEAGREPEWPGRDLERRLHL